MYINFSNHTSFLISNMPVGLVIDIYETETPSYFEFLTNFKKTGTAL